jgi:DNA invertase Pin-like site-specific DNA recombinase
MVCEKCNYSDANEKEINSIPLCSICAHFAPEKQEDFSSYIGEKIDWKHLDSFRKYNQKIGSKLKEGMSKQASQGKLMARPPLGYSVREGKLIQNQDAAKVHSLFTTFLNNNISLNQLSKQSSLSVNGLKKILTNRTYLGEIKFAGALTKASHSPIVSAELFYAVQRKLKGN